MASSQFFTYIDSLRVSNGWKKIFKKMHVIYHDNYTNGNNLNYHFWRMSSDFMNLPKKDRKHFFCNFNFFALILGPIYYFLKRMFVKGAILSVICLLLTLHNSTRILIVFVLFYCAYYGNRDYFVSKVLKRKNKDYNAFILNDPPDKVFICEVIAERYNFLPLILYSGIISSVFAIFAYNSFIQNYALQDYVESVPVVCSGAEECQKYILNVVKEISETKNKDEISKKYYLIAAAYYGYRDLYDAINSLDLALNINPNDINALYFRGSLRYKEGYYGQALSDYQEIIKRYPNAYFIHFYEGRCLYQLEMYDHAASSFKIAAKRGKNPAYYEYWGYAELKSGNKDEAIKILKKASKMYLKENGAQSVKKASALEQYIATLEKSR